MKILIDLQACQTASRSRGIGRYSLALAQALVRNCGSHDIHLLLNGQLGASIPEIRASFASLLPTSNLHVFEAPDFPLWNKIPGCFRRPTSFVRHLSKP
ncbi:MAG: hypothetical protein LVS60_02240 [Nodosilinea sp. LVE1205-7]